MNCNTTHYRANSSSVPGDPTYTQEYLTASSQRREKIKEEMERRGVSGPEAAEIAARSTREKKHTLTPAEVLTAHREVAAQFGNQPQRVVAEARDRAQAHQHNPDRAAHARESVTYARSSLFEREAVLDERLLLRDALRRGMGMTTYPEVRAEFEARQRRGDFLRVETQKYASARRFTTAETIVAERANIGSVRSAKNTVEPIMSAENAQRQARSRDFLNDAQRRVIEEILNSTDRIHGLQGRAGSGKTTVLRSIRDGAETSGFVVEGFAPTSRAAAQLREAAIDATTLQSFLARSTEPPHDIREPRRLYMLDESSLASTKQMRDFLCKLKPQDRVLVIGDTRQHQGVDAGRPFQQMQEAGMRTAQLDRIVRQKDPELLKAVEHLAKNETRQGMALLQEQGRVTEMPNRHERIAALAKDYAAQPANTIVVSPDNKSRQEINEAIRSELLRTGALKEDGQTFRTLSHRSDMTGADRTWAARYNVGDVLQYNTGSKELGIERGSLAAVRAVDAKANLLTVKLPDSSTITYDPRRLRGVNVFREEERQLATGDRIQFTASLKELSVANRDLATIQQIQEGRMTVLMDGKNKRTITFDTKQVRQIDHGYAVTSHSSQGLTAGRVLAHFDTDGPRALINQRLAYVAISRASEDARIYTNDAATLGKRLAADISKSAAVDLRPTGPADEVQRAISAFRGNQPAEATAILQAQGKVHEYASTEHRLAAVALAYTEKQDRALVIANDAAERHVLTQLIRDALRQQGRLSMEEHRLPVLIEQHFGNPRMAANYAPGDQIHYKVGSPAEHGLADKSVATVLSVDASANLLTVVTRDGNEVSYNPALLRKQTDQSKVYRQESRDIAAGERLRFTASNLPGHIHAGDFATVEKISDDLGLTARHDNGTLLALTGEIARHVEYGYAAERMPRSMDRVLVSGEATQLARQQQDFSRLSGQTRDLAIYTSDNRGLAQEMTMPGTQIATSAKFGRNNSVSTHSPEIGLEGYGIGR